jgi:hypothetical protein
MPFRFLPNSDPTRIAALDAAATKASGVPAADLPYPADVATRLGTLRSQFKQEAGEAAVALSEQTQATAEANIDFLALEMVVRHFIQVFNLAVDRGLYPASARAYYKLDVASGNVPPMDSQSAVTTWASDLIEGEAKRVAVAGAPMSHPSAANVQTALTAYGASSKNQSDAKDDYDDEQGQVAALRPAVDELIVDLWDEIEHTYRKLDGPGKRRKSREWGVVYVPRPGEEPEEELPPAPPATPLP